MKKYSLLILLTLLFTNNAWAKKNQAKAARAKNLAAVTIFVDINVLTRKKLAASKMTALHQQFAKENYQLVDVSIYTENGDLQGFYVSYRSNRLHK